MIYFLINNNYHYYDIKKLLLNLNRKDICLIEVPHMLQNNSHTDFLFVYKYTRSLKPGLLAECKNFIQQIKKFKHDITIKEDDFLFFYTEYEILNQYIARQFKTNGAKVYLIEDGGLASYLPFRMIVSESLSIKEIVKQWVYRRLPGLDTLRFHKLNGFIFPWMSEKFIDGLCLYRKVSILRDIPLILIKRSILSKSYKIKGTVIFTNQDLYNVYMTPENYINSLINILESLCNGFDIVYFKYHPRESKEWRQKIKSNVLSKFPSICIIDDNSAIEELIENYKPQVIASYFSASLLNLLDCGVEPLYLYHLFDDLNHQNIFVETTIVLHELGYNFIPSFTQINSNFMSGIGDLINSQTGIEISELVGQNNI